jgi:hypothetical protein
MKWVVRFEVDGYFVDETGKEKSTIVRRHQSLSEISAAMEALSLETDYKPTMLEGVAVIQKGRLVSPESIIEVKCKTIGKSQLGKQYHNAGFPKPSMSLLDAIRVDS